MKKRKADRKSDSHSGSARQKNVQLVSFRSRLTNTIGLVIRLHFSIGMVSSMDFKERLYSYVIIKINAVQGIPSVS